MWFYILLLFIPSLVLLFTEISDGSAFVGQNSLGPIIHDSDLKVESLIEGLGFPTTFAFLGDDDILFLEKEKGTIRRITNGQLVEDPLLNVSVAFKNERGMLEITIKERQNHTYVFLYYSEPNDRGNRLYRDELVNCCNYTNRLHF